jgi:hypothetical protein
VRAANFILAAWSVVSGIVEPAANTLADTIADGVAGAAASSAVLVPAAIRLLSVRKVKALLEQWREPA